MKDLSECSWRRHGEDVELDSDLQYENDNYIIRVYGGFVSDGGSLPRLSWSLLGITPYSPSCVLAFFVHDFLYSSQLLNRKISDNLLYEVLGIPPKCNAVQRWLIWFHVRLYGWLAWERKTRRNITESRNFGEVVRKSKLNRAVLK